MGAFAEFERPLMRERQREGIVLAKQRGACKGRKKTLTPERAAELVERAGAGVPKVVLARDYGISGENRVPVPAPREAVVTISSGAARRPAERNSLALQNIPLSAFSLGRHQM